MKKILASIFLMVLSLLMIGCVTIYEYASLSVLTKDENFNSAYVEVEMLEETDRGDGSFGSTGK